MGNSATPLAPVWPTQAPARGRWRISHSVYLARDGRTRGGLRWRADASASTARVFRLSCPDRVGIFDLGFHVRSDSVETFDCLDGLHVLASRRALYRGDVMQQCFLRPAVLLGGMQRPFTVNPFRVTPQWAPGRLENSRECPRRADDSAVLRSGSGFSLRKREVRIYSAPHPLIPGDPGRRKDSSAKRSCREARP